MGIDWQAFIKIYSDKETDLETILQKISKYFEKDTFTEENEGRVYRTSNCITFSYSPHTVGLSTKRLDLQLYELSKIVSDYPSCFIEGSWWADSGTMKRYVCWFEDDWGAQSKFISYETIDDQFYPHYGRYGRPIVLKKKEKKEKDIYQVSLCFESHTPFERESMQSLLESLGVAYYKGCSNWIHANYTSSSLDFLVFYRVLQDYEDSYVKVDWHLLDGTHTGEWAGHNSKNDITVQSIHYPTNPKLYKEWNSGDRVCINEQIKKAYEPEDIEPIPIPSRRQT